MVEGGGHHSSYTRSVLPNPNGITSSVEQIFFKSQPVESLLYVKGTLETFGIPIQACLPTCAC